MTDPHPPLRLSRPQRLRLRRALDREGRSYDPAERMLRIPFTSPGYHTTLRDGWVHPVRQSFLYAVALLDGGEVPERERALGILDRLLALQDADPASRTYGIWSWFLEEPLDRMSPPDWNWADFCGAQLLEIAFTHGPFLPSPFPGRIRDAILHAARSIQRRDVGPDYTNIAIMGTYVALAAAELYEVADLRSYAMAKLRRFHAYTAAQGGFAEYNSPNYTLVSLDELGRLLHHVHDAEAIALAGELYRRTWREIADHFHPPTGQWAGPHSRSYQTFLPPRVRQALHRSTDGRFPEGDAEPEIDEHRLVHVCPAGMEARFFVLEAREFRQTFLRGENGLPDTVGTTCLTPGYALGSVNAGDLWNQRRALQAYWGDTGAPSSLRLRFLHDGHDFAAAHLFAAQRGGDVLAGVGFAVDGGDTHVCLDMIRGGTIRARDLRLRFEVEGPAVRHLPAAPEALRDPWTLRDGSLRLSVAVPYAAWGESEGRWERGGEGDKAWLDVVLHAGEEREFRLGELANAALALALRCSEGESEMPSPEIVHQSGQLHVAWNGLKTGWSARPRPREALLRAFADTPSLP